MKPMSAKEAVDAGTAAFVETVRRHSAVLKAPAELRCAWLSGLLAATVGALGAEISKDQLLELCVDFVDAVPEPPAKRPEIIQ